MDYTQVVFPKAPAPIRAMRGFAVDVRAKQKG